MQISTFFLKSLYKLKYLHELHLYSSIVYDFMVANNYMWTLAELPICFSNFCWLWKSGICIEQMDLGVGSFIVANSLVSRQARGSKPMWVTLNFLSYSSKTSWISLNELSLILMRSSQVPEVWFTVWFF